MKNEGTRTETRFRLSANRTSPFKSAGASVQSTTGSRGVRISSSNAGYTMFRGSVKGTWLPTPFANFPFNYPPVRHRVPSHFNWSLPRCYISQPLYPPLGTAVAKWCATNRKVAGSIPAGVSGFFIGIKSFRSHYSPGVDSASKRNEYQEYFLGIKAAGA